jgi:hypothetical protein
MTYQLKKSAYLGVQMDGWSSGGRHLAALWTTVPGEQFFANAYENWREEPAANCAVAVNACLIDLLEVSPGARRPLQQGKVAGVTSDTTNVMPATVRELSQMPFFEGCIWVPCGCHVMNSHLLDQVKQVKTIKQLLALAQGDVDVFRIQAFCKIFFRHALPVVFARLVYSASTIWAGRKGVCIIRGAARLSARLRSCSLIGSKPGAGATHTKQQGNPLLVRGSIQCQLCSKPCAVFAARSFLTVSEEAGMHKRFAA